MSNNARKASTRRAGREEKSATPAAALALPEFQIPLGACGATFGGDLNDRHDDAKTFSDAGRAVVEAVMLGLRSIDARIASHALGGALYLLEIGTGLAESIDERVFSRGAP